MKILNFILILTVAAFAKEYKPKLEAGEHLFKKPLQYRFKEFNLRPDIKFLEVVSYEVANGKRVNYSDLKTVFKTDSRAFSQKDKNNITYLARVMIKKNYFWKYRLRPLAAERYFIIIYIDKYGQMFSVDDKNDLLKILGKIDTPAELLLWTYAVDSSELTHPYSYKKIKNGYRVREFYFIMQSCNFVDRFIYFNRSGKILKDIKKFTHQKNCTPAFF